MPTGKVAKLEVSHPCTVEDVKRKIFRREGIPPHCQRLTYNGRVLEDGIAVYDYNIQNRSKLELTLFGSKYTCTSILCRVVADTCNNFMIPNKPAMQQLSRHRN